MARHLIVIDSVLFSGAVATTLSASGMDAGTTETSREVAFASRRAVLEEVGSLLLSGAAATPSLPATAALSALSSDRLRLSATPDREHHPQDGRFDVLEALGALVVDDDVVDIQSLEGVLGIEVIRDMRIELPEPIVSQAAASQAGLNWHLDLTNARGVWSDGKGVLVGVLDTGIDPAHGEFSGKTIHFAEFDAVGRPMTSAAHDAGDHGTHVCGLIAGSTVGVAPGADLAVAAVLTQPTAGGGFSGGLIQISNGLNWLLTHNFRQGIPGVDLVNASLGGLGFNPYLKTAIANALLAPGVQMIAAIGNNARVAPHVNRHGSPGNYPDVIGVGATDAADEVADFSDWGTITLAGKVTSKPDLCAPGVQVRSCVPHGGYKPKDGTSMAAPIVCGFGARLLSQQPALKGNPAAFRAALMAKATGPFTAGPHGNHGGKGRIQG